VAKNLDVPIKLVFPRPAEASSEPGVTHGRSYSMLGLGDIVLPGLMIALALRFDLYMFYLRKQTKVNKEHCEGDMCVLREEVEKAPYTTVTGHWGEKFWTGGIPHSVLPKHLSTRFPKPYFTASMCGYVVGMVATLAFMTVFKHAQPALLYLVPCVLISTWGTGLVRGELKEMWGFSEAITAEADDEQETPIEDKAKESRGIFAEVWNELFGSRDHGKDKEVDEAKPSEPASMQRKSKHDPTSLFNFTISRHGRSTNTNENSETQETDQGAGDNNKSQINVSQDFASIGEDEMDKPSSLRYRAVSTQQGTVEKHQRLS
jgi:minor histocompatibility antigen H13